MTSRVFVRPATVLAITLITAAGVIARDVYALCPRGDLECAARERATLIGGSGIPRVRTPIGYVYTLNNDLTANGVVVLGRYGDGSLADVAGSPFAAGGKGLSCGDFDTQGSVFVNGQYLLAVNPGGKSIAVFQLGGGAKLSPVPGSPFPSGGSTPLSLTVSHELVYVANQACGSSDTPNITGFRMDGQGRLAPIPGSTITYPSGKGPAQVEFSPSGRVLAVTLTGFNGGGPSIHTYAVQQDGLLKEGPGSPASGEGGTIGFSWTRNSSYLLVSNFGANAVTVYSVNGTTGAVARKGPHYPNMRANMCWTALSPDGHTLYTANFSDSTISAFALGFARSPLVRRPPSLEITAPILAEAPAPDGTLSLLLPSPPRAPHTSIRNNAINGDTKDLQVTPDGKFLYVVGPQKKQIAIFAIGPDQLLTEVPGSPFVVKSGQQTTGLAVN